MTTTSTTDPAQAVSDRFMDLVRPQREAKHVTENDAFLRMVFRQLRALEVRAIDDPAILLQVLGLAARMDEIINVAIAVNAERYRRDPLSAPSQAECGKVLGVTKQAAGQRAERGRKVIARRLAAAGAVSLTEWQRKRGHKPSETDREREAIKAAAAEAVTRLADFRARRAS